MKKYFGTDGIRGRVGEGVITPDFVLRLGWAAGRVFGNGAESKVVIGKDTRISGYMFESALEAGLAAAGVDTYLLGPMPTPGIAYLTRTLHAQAGIVISASHNPFFDNGIKFFSADGDKLHDDLEIEIEQMVEHSVQTVSSEQLGKAYRLDDAAGRYIEFCKRSVPWALNFRGLKVIVDCAHGATYHIAPHVLDELGADVKAIGTEPDGLNINKEVGSTHPAKLREAVVSRNADMGIALDGDGDRVILIDHHGDEVDGDDMLYIIAKSRLENGSMRGPVVGTVMTNLGLEHALSRLGIGLERVPVGDRNIMERLRSEDWVLGGEPSGHIICRDRTTTGDGIIAALQVLAEMKTQGRALSELCRAVQKCPQKLVNVPLANDTDVMASSILQKAVEEVREQLGEGGRVLLRMSGTEPLLRIMVEGEEPGQVETLARQLAVVAEGVVKGE